MQRTAIIGTGIAGMGCGHFLHPHTDLTIYEQNDYIGGHTHTVTVEEDGLPIFIDTGFMVFNYETYPNLYRLFEMIHAPVKKTDMSFSVQHLPTGLEYSGSSLNHLFAQRKNLFSLSFLRMLRRISRFNKESIRLMDDPRYADYSIGQYIKDFDFGEDMLWKYLAPMSSAVWSTPMQKILDFPAQTLIRFFYNHGFLGLNTQHQWWTLDKGSRSYRDLLIQPFRDRIRLRQKVVAVSREENGVSIRTADGNREIFDRVILACHGDQALALLTGPTANGSTASGPTEEERRLLSAFAYQHNRAVVHTDSTLMPRKRLAWSSWNYRIIDRDGQPAPSTIYWMNRLQQVSDKKNYFVSINPQEPLDEGSVLLELDYEHPLFDIPAIRAQTGLSDLNKEGPVYFCGSYFNYGFHEDAFTSALQLCARLLQMPSEEDLWKSSRPANHNPLNIVY